MRNAEKVTCICTSTLISFYQKVCHIFLKTLHAKFFKHFLERCRGLGHHERMNTSASSRLTLEDVVLPVIRLLAAHYAGWREDYQGTSAPFPMSDGAVLHSSWAALEKLNRAHGDESDVTVLTDFAKWLSQQPFCHWSAFDAESGALWKPLEQSYRAFSAAHPQCEPFLSASPLCAELLCGFLLLRFQQ